MSIDATAYHSRYDPEREALRHLERTIGDRKPSLIVIIAGAMNYLGKAVAERHPRSVRVLLQPCDDFAGREVETSHARWSPGSDLGLSATLSGILRPELLAGGVAVVEWPPLARRYPAETSAIKEALRAALEGASADSATRSYWAARWLANCVRFARAAPASAALEPGQAPVLLACSGPSLEEALEPIAAARDRIALWSLASAVPTLLARGLSPDLVVATDPGPWNALHLRDAAESRLPLALPPSAYAPGWVIEGNPVLALDTGLSFERAALGSLGRHAHAASASGSAAGTALSLALGSTSGPVILLGYDLAARELLDHARGYAFDALDAASASRLTPACSRRAARVLSAYDGSGTTRGWRLSRAFSAYAAGIRPGLSDACRAYRVSPSPVDTPVQRLSPEEFRELIDPPAKRPYHGAPPRLTFNRQDSVPSGIPGGPGASEAARVEAMLGRLAAEARELTMAALSACRPLPEAASLYLSALAPRETAAFQAEAARGEATVADALAALGAAEVNARKLPC